MEDTSQRQIIAAAAADPTPAFSIGVSRNNGENRFHTNNTRSCSFSYLIMGATSSKDDEGYNENTKNNNDENTGVNDNGAKMAST